MTSVMYLWRLMRLHTTDPLTAEQVSYLQHIDSPTVANAIETLEMRDRCDGFLGGSTRALFPELGTMVGHALTVTMNSRRGQVASREGYWRMWDHLAKAMTPAVMVISDLSRTPSRCAYWGEVMGTIAMRLGAVGVVTDGAVRDLAELRGMGLHCYAQHVVVSHANFEIVDVGAPVMIDGQHVATGDIMHGDANGVVIVPTEAIDRLPDAVDAVRARERALIDLVKDPDFTLDALMRTRGY